LDEHQTSKSRLSLRYIGSEPNLRNINFARKSNRVTINTYVYHLYFFDRYTYLQFLRTMEAATAAHCVNSDVDQPWVKKFVSYSSPFSGFVSSSITTGSCFRVCDQSKGFGETGTGHKLLFHILCHVYTACKCCEFSSNNK